MMTDAQRKLRLDKTRWWILNNVPFYSQLCMRLVDVIGHPGVDTAATDGVSIFWNGDFMDTLTDEQLRGVMLHETDHCAHGHLWRLPIDEDGNKAGDYAINPIVAAIPGAELPDGVLIDSRFDGMAEEEILDTIRKEKPPQKPRGGCQGPDKGKDQGGTQGGSQAPAKPDLNGSFMAPADAGQTPGPSGKTPVQESWERGVIQASQLAGHKGLGDLPADLQSQLERINAQEIDWRRELADFVKTAIGDRNDWSRSARRHAWQPVIYPRKRRDKLGTIVFGCDVSGSVDDKVCAVYVSCIDAAIAETGCDGVAIFIDTKIREEHRLEPGDCCPRIRQYRGGTRFTPLFERARQLQEEGETIAGIVYLTDLMGENTQGKTIPDHGIPTLWVCSSDVEAPFGSVVRVKL